MNNRYCLYMIIWLAFFLLSVSVADLWISALAQTIPSPSDVYLPVVMKLPKSTAAPIPTATPAATPTPTLPPPNLDGCKNPPSTPVQAADYPIKIVNVDKTAQPETVTLKNVSNESVDLTGWHMCSVLATQEHKPIGGILAPDETGIYAYGGRDYIWNNDEPDDGALFNAAWQLVSYWDDPE
ncbi:MAG: hypothetical protein KDE53_40655 [Caldilineaceae bacterium]|nr:hypothetical protein [Caldilineaceae bacterium]